MREPIHETWLRFQKLLIQCPTHGVPDNVLLQYFYRSLDSVNKGIADHLVRGGLMSQSFENASVLLDEMTKINKAWHTREDHVSPLNFGMTKEQLEENQERDKNMAKMMTQMHLLTKHVMNSGLKAVNSIDAGKVHVSEDAKFDAMYKEECNT